MNTTCMQQMTPESAQASKRSAKATGMLFHILSRDHSKCNQKILALIVLDVAKQIAENILTDIPKASIGINNALKLAEESRFDEICEIATEEYQGAIKNPAHQYMHTALKFAEDETLTSDLLGYTVIIEHGLRILWLNNYAKYRRRDFISRVEEIISAHQ